MTVRGGPAPRPPRPALPYAPVLLPLLLVLTALAVVVATAHGQRPEQRPAVMVEADLAVVGGPIPVSQGGVVVLQVVLRDRGPGHRVASARVNASPVRAEPVVHPPSTVGPGRSRRFVVLLAPDCPMVGPAWGLEFRASLQVDIANGPSSRSLVLELGAHPAVAERVAALCRRR